MKIKENSLTDFARDVARDIARDVAIGCSCGRSAATDFIAQTEL